MTISRSRVPLAHRQYRGLLLPLASVSAVVVSACGGTTSKPAGIPSTADCTFSANTQYSNSGATGGIVINGLAKDTPCGYVTRKDSAVISLSVSLTAPCANIGTLTSPSGCNDASLGYWADEVPWVPTEPVTAMPFKPCRFRSVRGAA